MGRQGWGPHSKQSRWRIMLPELWSFNFYMWAHRLSTEPTIKHFPLKYQAWHFMISYNVFCPQYSNEVKELGDVEILLLSLLLLLWNPFSKDTLNTHKTLLNIIVSLYIDTTGTAACLLERQLIRKYQPKSEATVGHTQAIPNHTSVVTSTSLAENKQHNA